jgi:PadR family transcriptional regulator PadR
LTKCEDKVLNAIADMGGEASSFQIHQRLVGESKWAWIRAISLGGMYTALDRLERRGVINSRWGEATAARGWRRSRIYSIPF